MNKEKEHIEKEKYKEIIISSVKKINDITVLIKIYTLIKNL